MDKNISFENHSTVASLPSYPIECFYSDSYSHGTCSALHWHFYSELVYVNEGEQEITVGENVIKVYRGDLIYINPQQAHMAYSCGLESAALTVLKFAPEILHSGLNNEAERKCLAPFLDQTFIQNLTFPNHRIGTTRIPALLQNILKECQERRFGFEYAIRNMTCEIVSILMRKLDESDSVIFRGGGIAEEEIENFNRVMRYINDNFQQEIRYEALKEICHLSYSNFAVKFKRLTGKTLTEYVNFVRISYAQQILVTTKISITEIAAMCGFNDICYFSRVFRSLVGQSPQKFRKNAVLT